MRWILTRRKDARLVRFLLVGFSGIFVNSALLALAVETLGVHYLSGAGIATQGSTLWNYFWADVWVFGEQRSARPRWQRLGGYFLLNNTLLLIRAPLIAFFAAGLGLHYLIANLFSIGLLAMIRFIVSDRWIWQYTGRKDGNELYFYNIHQLIRVSSTTVLPELAPFQVSAQPDPVDIEIRTVPQRKTRSCSGAISYAEGLGDAGFWVRILRGEPTRVEASPALRRSPHVLYTNVVEPVLRWEFVRRGYALVHGACLSYGGQGLMVTAGTDTGKTTTILKSLDHYPFDFLSDDMVILSADGTLLTYPKPLTISRHTLSAVRAADLTLRERVALQIQSRLHSRMGRRIGMLFGNIRFPAATLNLYVQSLVPPPKYPVERLVPGVRKETAAHLNFIVVIERGEAPREELLSPEEMSEVLAANIEDAYGFPPYPALAGSLSRFSGRDLKAEETALIRSVVAKIPAVHLVRADYNWWQRIPGVFYGGLFEVDNPVSARYNTVPRGGHSGPPG